MKKNIKLEFFFCQLLKHVASMETWHLDDSQRRRGEKKGEQLIG